MCDHLHIPPSLAQETQRLLDAALLTIDPEEHAQVYSQIVRVRQELHDAADKSCTLPCQHCAKIAEEVGNARRLAHGVLSVLGKIDNK